LKNKKPTYYVDLRNLGNSSNEADAVLSLLFQVEL